MKRAFWLTLLAVVVFAGIVLARLPASWVIPSSGNLSCTAVDGSIWSGACSGLTVQGMSMGDVVWDLHPARLLMGKLAAHVVLTKGTSSARADVEVGLHKDITARNLVADLPLDPSVIPQMPSTLRGTAHLDLAQIRVERNIITQLQGRVELHDLVQRSSSDLTRLGDYSLTFPGGTGEPTGQLRDLGGPLSVDGTLRLTREPGFDLQTLVAARANASPDLKDAIQFLGSPDAQGRRPFGMSGTF